MTALDTKVNRVCIWAVLASQDRARSMDLGEMRHTSLSWALDSTVASRKSANWATERSERLISWVGFQEQHELGARAKVGL